LLLAKFAGQRKRGKIGNLILFPCFCFAPNSVICTGKNDLQKLGLVLNINVNFKNNLLNLKHLINLKMPVYAPKSMLQYILNSEVLKKEYLILHMKNSGLQVWHKKH